MAAIGLGSIASSFALKWLTTRLGANGQAAFGTLGTIVALFLFAAAREPVAALAASLIAGASSIIALTAFFVSAQVALPEWVRGRGLAIFLDRLFRRSDARKRGWGEVASLKGVPFALSAAAAGALIGMALTWRWKLQAGTPLDLSPVDALARAVVPQSGCRRSGPDPGDRRIS